MKKTIVSALILIMVFIVLGCESSNNDDKPRISLVANEKNFVVKETEDLPEVFSNHPVVTIEFYDYAPIVLELYPEIAPNTVNNFISLIQESFYDGLIFHRVVEEFMIQGGDPLGIGSGGPGYSIDAEFFVEKGSLRTYLSHKRGVISMARSENINSAGSQFFIMHQDNEQLDLSYTSFGEVIKGIETVDDIVAVEKGEQGNPIEDVVIRTISVDLNGYELLTPIINAME